MVAKMNKLAPFGHW